ncbi:helix-turn-helix transcriptional regulator [Pediococcus ethanolidurans]|uniref:helix-turn-helix transcriptional regulator n=2 Tax=Pediococcus ethanolidurans TaxID=319653 RepID=UPI001C1EEA32|nr:helix-turn-helix transcriptional regulator [Pediococcus ethanolidurans]MBU7563564.1 helix-turn-helix transcriptional regulator [Pediococcus ethanolidurans]MCT4398072.1 XRE family transcriptional regulator [Pediococcus ethanolidurans]
MLKTQLKAYREKVHLSQNQVSKELHITRQSISRWENGRGYPDMDNLILISQLYKCSIDDLLQDDQVTREKIESPVSEMKNQHKPLNYKITKTFNSKEELLLLFIILMISAFIPFLGVILPFFVIWRNKTNHLLHKIVLLTSIVIFLFSLYSSYIIINDTFFMPGTTTVQKIK